MASTLVLEFLTREIKLKLRCKQDSIGLHRLLKKVGPNLEFKAVINGMGTAPNFDHFPGFYCGGAVTLGDYFFSGYGYHLSILNPMPHSMLPIKGVIVNSAICTLWMICFRLYQGDELSGYFKKVQARSSGLNGASAVGN